MIDTLRRLLPATIELELDTDHEGTVVDADSGAVQQILLNLATNITTGYAAPPHRKLVSGDANVAFVTQAVDGERAADAVRAMLDTPTAAGP